MYLFFILCLLLAPLAADVSLKEKVGQMIIVGFKGQTIIPDSSVAKEVHNGEIAGVVLYDFDWKTKQFGRNIKSPEQLKQLCTQLQALSSRKLLIGIDQEGGIVSRLSQECGFPETFSQEYLGKQNDLSATRQNAELIAATLKTMGITLNFAPVVDVNINPENPCIAIKERSFSNNPQIVADHAREVVLAHRQHGIITALKHFPGHGSSTKDTHFGFVDVTKTWKNKELIPYSRLIKEGDVDMVMTSHIYHKELDPMYPATLSKRIMTDLLRNEMGFKGVIISDDLEMKAIAQFWSLEETVFHAIEAGVDILLFANQMEYDPEIGSKVNAMIVRMVEDGCISEERIDESYERITKLIKGT